MDDRAYQINAINSHQIEKGPSADDVTCDASNATVQHHLIEIVGEYQIDEEIRTLKETIEAGNVTEACASRYLVQDMIRRAQKKRNYAINKDRRKIELDVGDPVYYQAHNRQGKVDKKWRPYYRIVEKNEPRYFRNMGPTSGKG